MKPVRTGRTRGSTLLSAVLALGIIVITLTIMLQGYTQGSRFNRVQQHRALAFAACQGEMETLRAGGYAALRDGGGPRAAPGLPGGRLQVSIAAGPAPDTRLVTVTASWPAEELTPAGRVELATIFGARGARP